MKVAMMWSGGKDSYLAYQETLSKNHKVASLLNYRFADKKLSDPSLSRLSCAFRSLGRVAGRRTLTPDHANRRAAGIVPHRTSPEIVALQAEAMEVPILQWEVTAETFEDQLKAAIRKLELSRVEGVVWGVEEGEEVDSHKDLLSQVCDDLGIKLLMPLQGRSEEQILTYFIEKDCEVIITVVDSSFFDDEWLGCKIDNDFLRELRRLSRDRDIPSGCIEYHTLVTDAPLLKKRLEIVKSRKVSEDRYSILDISKVQLVGKM